MQGYTLPYTIRLPFVTSLDNKETFTGLRLIVIMRGAVGCHIRPFGVITYIGGKSWVPMPVPTRPGLSRGVP